MSSDQVLAAAQHPAAGRIAEPAVVVPLPVARLLGTASRRPRGADGGPRAAGPGIVTALADYLSARGRPTAGTAAPPEPAARAPRRPRAATLPPRVRAHAAELESLLRDHIDGQLDLLREHAPEFRQSVDTIHRSVDLLLRLRDR